MGAYEPDDWNSHYDICPACGQKYHRSGAEPCACEQCIKCEKMFPPEQMYNADLCVHCCQCEYCGLLSSSVKYIESKGEQLCERCTWADE